MGIGFPQRCRASGQDPPGATVQLMFPEIAVVFCAAAFCAALGALALFQMLLIVGLPLGRYAWGGQNRVLPARLRVGSAIAIAIYAVMAVIALGRAELISVLPPLVAAVAMWVVAAYLLLSVVPNLASKSQSERRVMVPVSLLLAVLAVAVALG